MPNLGGADGRSNQSGFVPELGKSVGGSRSEQGERIDEAELAA
jgi:hypothetical protein